jgi:hypothetical protein
MAIKVCCGGSHMTRMCSLRQKHETECNNWMYVSELHIILEMMWVRRMTFIRMSAMQTTYLPRDFTMGEWAVVKCTSKKTEAFY